MTQAQLVVAGRSKVQKFSERDASRVFDRLRVVSREIQASFMELGQLYFMVRQGDLFKFKVNPVTRTKYTTWAEFVSAEGLFSERQIAHMMACWWWFSGLDTYPQIRDQLIDLGPTKARELVGVADESNIDEWVRYAKGATKGELIATARASMVRAGAARRPRQDLCDRASQKGVPLVKTKIRVKTVKEPEPVPVEVTFRFIVISSTGEVLARRTNIGGARLFARRYVEGTSKHVRIWDIAAPQAAVEIERVG